MSAEASDRPRYVAIIMDGNARWAASRGLGVTEGHRAGTDTLKRTVDIAGDLGIEQLTVYAFSTENWARPEGEVSGIMSLFVERLRKEAPELDERGCDCASSAAATVCTHGSASRSTGPRS